jgi:hypothetical protein
MVGWLDGWMVGWLDGWMVGWLAGWLAGLKLEFLLCDSAFSLPHIAHRKQKSPHEYMRAF